MKIKINKKSFVIFITVALIILFFSGYSIGREITRTDISGNADIAKPILVIDDEEKININSQNKIGTYKFTIKNFDDNGNINECDLEYYIEITTKLDDQVMLNLYKDETELQIKENKTQAFELKKEEKQEDKYKIEMKCDNIDKLEQIVQEIKIKVHSEQKKD